jgi:integrase
MARQINRLTPRAVAAKRKPGYYADGGGLYLQVKESGAKSWILRFMLNGRAREMGLGGIMDKELAKARGDAQEARNLVRDGVDPIDARGAEKKRMALDVARSMTFAQCAATYIEAHKAGWKNAKHASQWTATLETYCGPVFGAQPVQAVDTALVCKVLEPMWQEKPETATRLRARIERVLDWATVRGYRDGDNPARWRGHLDKLLPMLKKNARVKHHAALPFAQVGAFMADLRLQEGVAARALEFLILTATRTSEVTDARWDEINLNTGVWTIPAERMKAGREHRVPLPAAALTLVKAMGETRLSDFVFQGRANGVPLSNMAMLELLKRMGRADITVHGFRSTFKDWASESTNYPREVTEMALAHTIGDKVEAAYRRGDLFDKRRLLMTEWARHCGRVEQPGKVVSLRRKRA